MLINPNTYEIGDWKIRFITVVAQLQLPDELLVLFLLLSFHNPPPNLPKPWADVSCR
jgi:hypothetical protein